MADAQPNGAARPRDANQYAGFSRFEMELEFVQSLANPLVMQQLALQKYLDDPAFCAYLKYLEYFREPEYMKFLSYPGPTLRALELLQEEQFRKDIISPLLVERLVEEGFRLSTAGVGPK